MPDTPALSTLYPRAVSNQTPRLDQIQKHNQIIILRGGDNITMTGGGFGKDIRQDRFFLVEINEAQLVSNPSGITSVDSNQFLNITGRVLEVFREGGDSLKFEPHRSVHTRSEFTKIYIPLDNTTKIPEDKIGVVKPEYEKVWSNKFQQVFHDTAPLSLDSQSKADTAVQQMLGRIRHIGADDLAREEALAEGMKVFNKISETKGPSTAVKSILEYSTYDTSIDLMNLTAESARQKIEDSFKETLISESAGRAFQPHELASLEIRLKEVYFQDSFPTISTQSPGGVFHIGVTDRHLLPNQVSDILDDISAKEQGLISSISNDSSLSESGKAGKIAQIQASSKTKRRELQSFSLNTGRIPASSSRGTRNFLLEMRTIGDYLPGEIILEEIGSFRNPTNALIMRQVSELETTSGLLPVGMPTSDLLHPHIPTIESYLTSSNIPDGEFSVFMTPEFEKDLAYNYPWLYKKWVEGYSDKTEVHGPEHSGVSLRGEILNSENIRESIEAQMQPRNSKQRVIVDEGTTNFRDLKKRLPQRPQVRKPAPKVNVDKLLDSSKGKVNIGGFLVDTDTIIDRGLQKDTIPNPLQRTVNIGKIVAGSRVFQAQAPTTRMLFTNISESARPDETAQREALQMSLLAQGKKQRIDHYFQQKAQEQFFFGDDIRKAQQLKSKHVRINDDGTKDILSTISVDSSVIPGIEERGSIALRYELLADFFTDPTAPSHIFSPLHTSISAIPSLKESLETGQGIGPNFNTHLFSLMAKRREAGLPVEDLQNLYDQTRRFSETHFGGRALNPIKLLRAAKYTPGGVYNQIQYAIDSQGYRGEKPKVQITDLLEYLSNKPEEVFSVLAPNSGKPPTQKSLSDIYQHIVNRFVRSRDSSEDIANLGIIGDIVSGVDKNGDPIKLSLDDLHSSSLWKELSVTDPEAAAIASITASTKEVTKPGLGKHALSIRDYFGQLARYAETASAEPGDKPFFDYVLSSMSALTGKDLGARARFQADFFGFVFDPRSVGKVRLGTAQDVQEMSQGTSKVQRFGTEKAHFEWVHSKQVKDLYPLSKNLGFSPERSGSDPLWNRPDLTKGHVPGYNKWFEGLPGMENYNPTIGFSPAERQFIDYLRKDPVFGSGLAVDSQQGLKEISNFFSGKTGVRGNLSLIEPLSHEERESLHTGVIQKSLPQFQDPASALALLQNPRALAFIRQHTDSIDGSFSVGNRRLIPSIDGNTVTDVSTGLKYLVSSDIINVEESALGKALKSGVHSKEASSAEITIAKAGSKEIPLSPNKYTYNLERFLEKVQEGSSSIIGLDTETFLLEKDGIKSAGDLRNTGFEKLTFDKTGKIVSRTSKYEAASNEFIADRDLSNIHSIDSDTRYSGSTHEKLIEDAYNYLNAEVEKDSSVFFSSFNTGFDFEYLKDHSHRIVQKRAQELERLALLDSQQRNTIDPERLAQAKTQLEESQRVFTFFNVEAPKRIIEAAQILELSGVSREGSKLEHHLRALGIQEPQTHTAYSDVFQMSQGMEKGLSSFLENGPATLETKDLVGLYMFAHHPLAGKSPFRITGITEAVQGEEEKPIEIWGQVIDKQGRPLEDPRLQITQNTPGSFQRRLASGTFKITDASGINEGFKSILSDENLTDLIERDIRRATSDQPWMRDNYIARGRISGHYDSLATDEERSNFTDHIREELTKTETNDQYLQNLSRTDKSEVLSWIDRGISKWGYLDPRGRQTWKRVGEKLEERAETRDKLFLERVTPRWKDGKITDQEYKNLAMAYTSLTESLFEQKLRPKIVEAGDRPFPRAIDLKYLGDKGYKTTRLTEYMSEKEIFNKLFEHGSSTIGSQNLEENLKAVGDSFNLYNKAESILEKIIALDSITRIGKEFPDRVESLGRELASRMEGMIGRSAPELSDIGTNTRGSSLAQLAKTIHDTFQSTSMGARNALVSDDMYTGNLTNKGRDVSSEDIAHVIDTVLGISFSEETSSEWDRALTHKVRQESFATKTALELLQKERPLDPPILAPIVSSTVLDIIKAIPDSTYPVSSVKPASPKPTDIMDEIQERESLAEMRLNELELRASRESSSKIEEEFSKVFTPQNIKIAVGAAALIALAGEFSQSLMSQENKKDGVLPPGTPISTHEHDAGPHDRELNNPNSEASQEGQAAWKKLNIEVEFHHPGFPGSLERLDNDALSAYSNDVSAVLTKHFGQPTNTNSQSSSRDDTLKNHVDSILSKAYSRFGVF